MTFSYFAYGLGIRSALPIPEFLPAEIAPDVTITVAKNSTVDDYLPPDVIEQSMALKLNSREGIIYWQRDRCISNFERLSDYFDSSSSGLRSLD